MKCELEDKIIERFYEGDMSFVEKHINSCEACKKIFALLRYLDYVKFSAKPSHTVDLKIISYARYEQDKQILKAHYLWLKNIFVSAVLSFAVFLFIFFPVRFGESYDVISERIITVENEIGLLLLPFNDENFDDIVYGLNEVI